MTIQKSINGKEYTYKVSGYLDTSTSPDLDRMLKDDLFDIGDLVFDFSDLVYISSSGIRVLLSMRKAMTGRGKMVLRNVQQAVMDVLDMVGLTDFLTFE